MNNSKDDADNPCIYHLTPNSQRIASFILQEVAYLTAVVGFEPINASHTQDYDEKEEEDNKNVDDFVLVISTKQELKLSYRIVCQGFYVALEDERKEQSIK